MPAYNTTGNPAINALYPGDTGTAWNAETLTAPVASVQFGLPPNPLGQITSLSVQLSFATTPTAVVDIQVANVDADANYVTVATSSNTSPALKDFQTAAQYVRLNLASQTGGGAVTASISRK